MTIDANQYTWGLNDIIKYHNRKRGIKMSLIPKRVPLSKAIKDNGAT